MCLDEFIDLDICLGKLFLEISFLIAFYFTTNRNNQARAVSNFVYYFKNETKGGPKRWICNVSGCSASVTTNKFGQIIKLNNMPKNKVDSLESLHPKHEP